MGRHSARARTAPGGGAPGRAARTADRINGLGQPDNARRHRSVLAAEAGLVTQAAALEGYAVADRGAYRIDNAGQAWLDDRDAAAVADDESPPQAPHRRDMLAPVAEVEAVLAERERVAEAPEPS